MYVIVLEILPLGSCLYCGCHVSHNALVFSRSIGKIRRRATSFSQRLLVKLHCYRAMIRGSKLLLRQVYFAVSLLPFGASRQPKYVSSYCCSYLLSRELLVFSFSPKVSFTSSRVCWNRFHSCTIANAYCQVVLLVQLSCDYQIVILSRYI